MPVFTPKVTAISHPLPCALFKSMQNLVYFRYLNTVAQPTFVVFADQGSILNNQNICLV